MYNQLRIINSFEYHKRPLESSERVACVLDCHRSMPKGQDIVRSVFAAVARLFVQSLGIKTASGIRHPASGINYITKSICK